MDLTGVGGAKAELAMVGMRIEKQSKAVAVQVVGQALENSREVAKAAPTGGRGARVDIFA